MDVWELLCYIFWLYWPKDRPAYLTIKVGFQGQYSPYSFVVAGAANSFEADLAAMDLISFISTNDRDYESQCKERKAIGISV